MSSQQIIIGIHSIAEALNNELRKEKTLYTTSESLKEIKKWVSHDRFEKRVLGPHQVQDEAKKLFIQSGFHYQRVPSNCFLLCDHLEEKGLAWLYDLVDKKQTMQLLVLDQVTDIHNAAAILRTSSFYGVDAVLVSQKGGANLNPAFTRIASGALEHVPYINCASLPKTLAKLMEKGVQCLALSEHEEESEFSFDEKKSRCLVLGAEDRGLSHALLRIIPQKASLKARGKIRSLNVASAAAVALERYLGGRGH